MDALHSAIYKQMKEHEDSQKVIVPIVAPSNIAMKEHELPYWGEKS